MSEDRPTVGHVLHRMDRAGAEVLAGDLARRLSDRYRSVFFCLDGIGALGETLASEGFAVTALGRRPGLDLRVAGRLRAAVKRHDVALLHAHQYTPFCYAALSRRLSATPPILFTEHGRHYPDQRKAKRVWANRWLLKPTDRVTAVGRFVKQALIENERIAENRVDVVYNGIDPDAFPPADTEARARARHLIDVDAETPLVMQVARFHPVKDHALSVRAFARVVKCIPAARLCLVGDGPERPATEALAAELGIHDHVLFLGVRDDVDKLLPGADLFVLSSLSEGVSVTLLESMATGLPIVATDVGGNGEVVIHDETGLLSPRGNDEALAENLITLLGAPDRRAMFGRAGRVRLLETFTQDRMHRQYANLYGRMLGMSPG